MKPTIICVDDEKVVRDSLKDQLKREFSQKARVETAESGEATLELIDELMEDKEEIPVVITDHIMPGIKGDELLVKLHDLLPSTFKIMLTGQASADAVGNAVNNANLYRYVAKPWEREDLNLTVREAFKSFYRNKQLDEQNVELRALNSDLGRKNDAFFRYVPQGYLRLLGFDDNFEQVELGMGVDKDLAILFADIREFTPLCEGLTPAECVEFINSYVAHIEGPITENGGFIHDFLGDGVLALFSLGASQAVRAGVGMLHQMGKFSARREKAGKREIRIGVGINAGHVTLGTIGSATRMNCGVAGDPVNLASRVESLTKSYGCNLLISHHVVKRLERPDEFTLRQVDRVLVKGRSQPVELFEVLDAEPPDIAQDKIATLATYADGIKHYYAAEFIEAGRLFAESLARNPRDQIALTYLARCREYMEGVPSDWTGVEPLIHK